MAFIYKFLKWLVNTSFGLFFAERVVINKELLQQQGAKILVSNHPNTLIDPLNLASNTNRTVHFLANADLFSGKFNHWFFNTFFCIPIKRKQDTKAKHIKNEHSFERCDAFLTDGGCLYIAPEGVSELERRLRPFKTGTARIALSAESKNDFSLGLTIVAVGLTYTAPTRFRSKVIIHAGNPIKISDYKAGYSKNTSATIRDITQDIENTLRTLIIDTTDEEEDEILRCIEIIVNNDEQKNTKEAYFRSKRISEYLKKIRKESPEMYRELQEVTHTYFQLLKKIKTSDKAVKAFLSKKSTTNIGNWISLLLGLPLFLYGFLNNILPASIPLFLMKKLKIHPGYASTVKILGGMLTFPLFYTLQAIVIHFFIFNNKWLTILYFLSLIPSGLLAWKFYNRCKEFLAKRKLLFFVKNNKGVKEDLAALRQALTTCFKEMSNNITQNIR